MTDYKRAAKYVRHVVKVLAPVTHGEELEAYEVAARLCEREELVQRLLSEIAEAVKAGECWDSIAYEADRVREFKP